jgi:hypothetical protein
MTVSGRRETCFMVKFGVPNASPCLSITLKPSEALALATLVPLLGCGEEAAALAFDGLAEGADTSVERYALQGIAAEERVHDVLLVQLAASLPAIDATAIRRKARRFHITLARGGGGQHLARIAAIDAAVCTILSRLLRAGTPISRDTAIRTMLARIRRDEARHVAISRQIARRSSDNIRDTGADARSALADILTIGADAFERLAVDPDQLFTDIRRLPKGLFAS